MNKLSKINDLAFDLTHEYMEPGKQFSYGKQIYDLSDEQELNKNQQIVLKHLKSMCPPKLGLSAMVTVYCLVDDNINDNWQEYSEEIPEHIEALQKLSVAEEFQVLTAFAQWGLEQEEQR
ncbi:hypothetical protein [Enterococcus faecalis]|nr:hypothetical protein [Enterococcus faecalis]